METFWSNVMFTKPATCLLRASIWLFFACGVFAARRPSSALMITKYRAATCIPPLSEQLVQQHTRRWKATLSLHDGSKVTVTGAQIAGGRVTVSYSATGDQYVVADAGDYIYPTDVRIDSQNDLLYVKAQGLAAGVWEQTWLFEYDLRRRRQIARRRVRNSVLSEDCPASSEMKR